MKSSSDGLSPADSTSNLLLVIEVNELFKSVLVANELFKSVLFVNESSRDRV
jgi:hypothetical protein